MTELVLRTAFSLALVLAVLTVLARMVAKRQRGSGTSPLRVLHRQGLGKGSTMAVVAVGERVLLVGATEQQVRLLTELDGDELAAYELEQLSNALADQATERPAATFDRLLGAARARRPGGGDGDPGQGALSGSLLSPRTWRQAAQVFSGRGS